MRWATPAGWTRRWRSTDDALRLERPGDADFHYNLGMALKGLGRAAESSPLDSRVRPAPRPVIDLMRPMDSSPQAKASRLGPAGIAAGVIIFLAGLAAYHNSLSGPFTFDDAGSILENSTIHHLWPPGPALSPPFSGARRR